MTHPRVHAPAASRRSSVPSPCSTCSPRRSSSAPTRSPAAPASTPARSRACWRRSLPRGSSTRSTRRAATDSGSASSSSATLRSLASTSGSSRGRTCAVWSRPPARRRRSRSRARSSRSPSTSSAARRPCRASRRSAGPASRTPRRRGRCCSPSRDVSLPGGTLRAYTANTIVARPQLEREITRVRSQGWAQAVREREDDLNAIAAPVRDAAGELVAVLGVQGPASRFGEGPMHDARRPLLAAAAASLGHARLGRGLTTLVRRQPDEARRFGAHPPGGPSVRTRPHARPVGAEDEQPGSAFGDQFEQRLEGTRADEPDRSTSTASEWASSAGARSGDRPPR